MDEQTVVAVHPVDQSGTALARKVNASHETLDDRQ